VSSEGRIDTLSMIDDGAALGVRRVPYLFLVLEGYNPTAPPLRIALEDVDEVVVGRGLERGCEVAREVGLRRVILRIADPWLSSMHARFTRSGRGWAFCDAGSKNGSFLLGKRIESAEVEDGTIVELGHTFFLFREAEPALAGVPSPVCGADATVPGALKLDLATLSPSFAAKLAELGRLARSDVPVVLEGETGTGKEVAARALHEASGRGGDFVAINCGALPATLIEAELFGAKKGAFSGANEDRPGLVRAASGGTLLLDEIGELSAQAQAALLRVLQEREVLPIGGTKPVPVDVRFIAATHRPLDRMVEAGTFRRDLVMRLAGYRLRLPALRERLEDMGLLAGALLSRHCGAKVPTVAPKAARALFRFGWPGNVRQLERALSAAAPLAGGSAISLEHLPEEVRAAAADLPGVRDEDDAVQREELLALLKEHRGNVSAVARAMGKARMQVQRWMKRFALTPEQFR
jgi:transcriptional regulator with AAA-type ATPase domain